MTVTPLICSVYRSSKKDETYVYVNKSKGLDKVPEALLNALGKLDHSMDFILTQDKKLARAKAADVIAALDDTGFYLQMPPTKDNNLLNLHKANLTSAAHHDS